MEGAECERARESMKLSKEQLFTLFGWREDVSVRPWRCRCEPRNLERCSRKVLWLLVQPCSPWERRPFLSLLSVSRSCLHSFRSYESAEQIWVAMGWKNVQFSIICVTLFKMWTIRLRGVLRSLPSYEAWLLLLVYSFLKKFLSTWN